MLRYRSRKCRGEKGTSDPLSPSSERPSLASDMWRPGTGRLSGVRWPRSFPCLAAWPQAGPIFLGAGSAVCTFVDICPHWALLPWQCLQLSEPQPPTWDCPERGSVPGGGGAAWCGPWVQCPPHCSVPVGGGLPGEEEGGREHPEEKLRLDLGLVESAGERSPQVSPPSAPPPAGHGPPPPSLPQPSSPGSSCSGARGARPRSACGTPAS